MVTNEELAFADQVGRFGARHWSLPPMTGRVLGWLMICDPPEQTAAEVADALKASRSAISTAVTTLENVCLVDRSRAAGERVDRIRMHPLAFTRSLQAPDEYVELAALAEKAMATFGNDPPSRWARLAETGAFAAFLSDRMPKLKAEWEAHRDAMRASGELPHPGAIS